MANCKSCGASIKFIKTRRGKYMPCDTVSILYRIDQEGKDTAVTLDGDVVKCEYVTEKYDGVGYRPHWGTCTNPAPFRKGRAE